MAAPQGPAGGFIGGTTQALNFADARTSANTRMDVAGGKQDPQQVNLREAAQPAQSCGTCFAFDGRNGCSTVGGNVAPAQVCDLWKPASGDMDADEGMPPAGAPPAPMM